MKDKIVDLAKKSREFLAREKVRKYISWSAAAIMVLVVLFLTVPLLPNSPYSLRMVTSNSMSPTFNTGSLVVITPEKDYQKGEVITYQEGEYKQNVVTHRIVKREEKGFVTKGDANAVPDDTPVPPAKVHGKVVFSIPWGGYIIDFLQRPVGFVLVIMVPVLIIVWDEAKNILKEIKKFKKQ